MRLHAGGVDGGGTPTSPPPPGCYEEFNYTFEVIGEGNTLTFVPGIDPSANVTQVVWDFGDGSPFVSDSVPTTIMHTFPYDGNFLVNMAVYTDNNCNGLHTQNVASNCTPSASPVLPGNMGEIRASTFTDPPVGLAETTVITLKMCDIPTTVSGQYMTTWLSLEPLCCATTPMWIEPRREGGTTHTCVRTGAEEFTFTTNALPGPGGCTDGISRVFILTSPAFNVNYAGPYGTLVTYMQIQVVSGPPLIGGCNMAILFDFHVCGTTVTSALGQVRLTAAAVC